MTGERPSFRSTAIRPASSNQASARYLALRSKPNGSPARLLRGTVADRSRLAVNQIAIATCRDLPGSLAAVNIQFSGIGPLRNFSPALWRGNRCFLAGSCFVLSRIRDGSIVVVYDLPYIYR